MIVYVIQNSINRNLASTKNYNPIKKKKINNFLILLVNVNLN